MAETTLDFVPMRVHKALVIQFLQQYPQDVGNVFTKGQFATAEEAIAALQAHPGVWVVDGVLRAEEEAATPALVADDEVEVVDAQEAEDEPEPVKLPKKKPGRKPAKKGKGKR